MVPVRIKIEKEINSLLDKALPNDYQKLFTVECEDFLDAWKRVCLKNLAAGLKITLTQFIHLFLKKFLH